MGDRNYGLLDILLVGAVLVLSVAVVSPKVRHWITDMRVDRGSIATVVFQDPESGKSRKYEVSRFVEMKEGYCQFITTDGLTVEVVENIVTEK